jgi:hypothetical protein
VQLEQHRHHQLGGLALDSLQCPGQVLRFITISTV